MPLKGVHCVRGYVDLVEHRRCMVEEPGPPCGIEPSILEMMTRPNMEREEEHVVFSPSSFSSCQRQPVLSRDSDWYVDVKQAYKTIRGTIVHQGMGQEPPYPGVLGVVREKRMSSPIDTKFGRRVFKGKPDLVVLLRIEKKLVPGSGGVEDRNVLHVKLVDYKTKSEVGHDLIAADRRHVYQVNMYAWLLTKFLPGYLSGGGEWWEEHVFLNDGVVLPNSIDEVVVDELSIVYMDMVKVRTFSSSAFLYNDGKMLGDRINGRWVRRYPPEYDELELEPIHQFQMKYVESLIRKGIEEQIEHQTVLAPPLTGDDAKLMCRNCPVRQTCYVLGKREGYDMKDQEPYVEGIGTGELEPGD